MSKSMGVAAMKDLSNPKFKGFNPLVHELWFLLASSSPLGSQTHFKVAMDFSHTNHIGFFHRLSFTG